MLLAQPINDIFKFFTSFKILLTMGIAFIFIFYSYNQKFTIKGLKINSNYEVSFLTNF